MQYIQWTFSSYSTRQNLKTCKTFVAVRTFRDFNALSSHLNQTDQQPALFQKVNYSRFFRYNLILNKVLSFTVHCKSKSRYLPAIPSLLYMMKDINHISNSSWTFFDFCSKKDTCHRVNLQYKFWKTVGSAWIVPQLSNY